MDNIKLLKAYCKESKQHFGIKIQQEGGVWRAVGFFPLTAREAQFVRSAVRQKKFEIAPPLSPCGKCGSATVGGCGCHRKPFTCRRGPDRLADCIYCKKMKIDYTTPTAVSGYQDGDIVRLSQGQSVRISYGDARPVSKITVGLGWDPNYSLFSYNIDLDASVLVAGETGHELIYYADRRHPSGCVVHEGDNRTGINPDFDEDLDDETITVNLDKVPADRDRLIFLLNVFRASVRGQTLGDARDMYLKVYDPASDYPIIEYRVDENIKDCTALVVGEAYREGDGWVFRAIGRGSMAKKVTRLAEEALALCREKTEGQNA